MIFVTISRGKRAIFVIGSVQEVFCGLRFRLNRFKHSVKRFGRFCLDTLLRIQKSYTQMKNETMFTRSILILSCFVLGIYCQTTTHNCKDNAKCGVIIDTLIVNQNNPKGKLIS